MATARQAMVTIGRIVLCLLAFTAGNLSHPESLSYSPWDIWNLEPHRHAGTWLLLDLLSTYVIGPGPEHLLSPCIKSGSGQFQYGHGCLDKRCV